MRVQEGKFPHLEIKLAITIRVSNRKIQEAIGALCHPVSLRLLNAADGAGSICSDLAPPANYCAFKDSFAYQRRSDETHSHRVLAERALG